MKRMSDDLILGSYLDDQTRELKQIKALLTELLEYVKGREDAVRQF